MSAHCHHCGADLVYAGEWPAMECPVCSMKDELERLREQLASLDEQNMMHQDYLRQIRDAAAIEYARGLAQEAIERSR